MTVLKGDLIIYRESPEAASVQLHDYPRNNPGGCVKHTLDCNWLFTDVFGERHPYRIPWLIFGMNNDRRVIDIEIIFSTDDWESEGEDIHYDDDYLSSDYLSRRLGPFNEASPGGSEYVAIAFPKKYPNVIEVQLRGYPNSGESKNTISLRSLAEYGGPEIYLDFDLQFQLVRIRIVYPSEGESGNRCVGDETPCD